MILKHNSLDLGAGKTGKQTETTDTKLLKERDLKLPKSLKDMMTYLSEKGVINDHYN